MAVPRRELVILAGILGVGLLMRLYRIDLTWYFLDQARDVSTAAAIAAGESVPLLGPLIGWTHGRLGPLYFYLIAPPFLVSGSPLAGAVYVALAGVLAIGLLHRLARDAFGPSVALVASALFAVFPLAVLSARVLWNPALVPLFTVLFMRALFQVIVRGRSGAIVGVFAWLAVLTQLHLGTVSLGLVAIVAVLVSRPRLRFVHLLLGIGVFLALYAPYLVHEIGHRFENTRALLSAAVAGSGERGERALLAVLGHALTLDRRVLDGFVVADAWPAPALAAFSFLWSVEAALFGVGLLVCLYRLARGGDARGVPEPAARRAAGLLLLWVLVPLLMLGTRRTALWWYYFDLLYPSQFIVAALAVSTLASARLAPGARRVLVGVGTACVVAIVATQAWFQIGLQRRIDRQGEIVLDVPRLSVASAPSSIGTLAFLPYGYRERLLRALVDDLGLRPEAFPARVHGPVLGPPQENEVLLRRLAARAAGSREAAAAHYLVVKAAGAAPPPTASRTARVGPYLIIEYQPTVDYQSWSWARLSRGPGGLVADAGWQRGAMPAGDVGAAPGDDRLLAWRVGSSPSSAGRPATLTVSVIASAPLELFRLDGEALRLVPLGGRSWQSPSLYWTTEADIAGDGGGAPPRADVITFAVAGSGRVARVDVYERLVP
jgi:hypothetical protein